MPLSPEGLVYPRSGLSQISGLGGGGIMMLCSTLDPRVPWSNLASTKDAGTRLDNPAVFGCLSFPLSFPHHPVGVS